MTDPPGIEGHSLVHAPWRGQCKRNALRIVGYHHLPTCTPQVLEPRELQDPKALTSLLPRTVLEGTVRDRESCDTA